MTIHTRIRTLGAAALLALTIAGGSAAQVGAETNQPPQKPTTCTLTGQTVDPPTENDLEFYNPGDWEVVKKPNGDRKMVECQKDGTWKVVDFRPPVGGTRPVATGVRPAAPLSGGVLAPVTALPTFATAAGVAAPLSGRVLTQP